MHSLQKPHSTKRKGEIHIGTIAFLLLALLVIVAVLMGTGTVSDYFKKVFDFLGGKHKDAAICENYKVITDEQDLLDLIYYTQQGACGGEKKDDPFYFTIDNPIGGNGIEFKTGMSGGNCGPLYFCGGHSCNLGHLVTGGTNPVYMQFGDVERSESTDCSYTEEWGFFENQACAWTDPSDLIIMGPSNLMSDTYPCSKGSTDFWCADIDAVWYGAHTMKNFAIKKINNPIKVDVIEREGKWGIRREGKDVVICLTTKETGTTPTPTPMPGPTPTPTP